MSKFSILNESNLHKTLKTIYAYQTNGSTEVEKFGYIYDIISEDEEMIELQNQNLKQLLPKIKDTLDKGLKIKIVHPVIIKKTIELQDDSGIPIKISRSSKKGSIYDIFNDITGIYPVLLNKNFKLEVPEINITEIRIKEEDKVQSKNKKRHFKKDWNKINKKLDEIITTHIFKDANDYLKLLPSSLPEEFCSKELSECLKKEKLCPARIYNNANLIIWVLKKMNLVSQTKIKKKNHYFRITIRK